MQNLMYRIESFGAQTVVVLLLLYNLFNYVACLQRCVKQLLYTDNATYG